MKEIEVCGCLWDSQDNQGIAPCRLLAKHAQSCNARPQKLHRQLLRPKPSRNRRICWEIPADADSIQRHLDKDGYGMIKKTIKIASLCYEQYLFGGCLHSCDFE